MRHDIEQTRDHMSDTIDAIADRTSPRRIVGRQRRRLSDRVHGIRETVMGSAEGSYGGIQQMGSGFGQSAQHGAELVVDEVRRAPEELRRQTQGNPLAAGLIAFGGGLLAAAVIPSSRTEREAAARLEAEAQPAMQQLKEAGQQVAEGVMTTAQQAVQDVKDTASESARQVAEEAKSSAEQVQQQARPSTGNVAEGSEQATPRVSESDDPGLNRSL